MSSLLFKFNNNEIIAIQIQELSDQLLGMHQLQQ